MVFNIKDSQKRRVKTDFPREIEKKAHSWIPMSDGRKLAATIWLPVDADENPVPAILEYIPYRKNDFTAIRDSVRHPYFAGHGYASIRVDIGGTGDSDGYLKDEYLKQEQDDALEVLSWIEQQVWSTGAVGMIGKSWGGFNSLQVAARQHPALRAIITLCSTDDRYADDVHYRGGNVLASDMLWWASTMFAYNARPQDPELVGEAWKENWLERLEKTPPFVEEWLRHQRRDDYWKHGSVCENIEDITIPVFAVSGWQDGYTDAVFRLLQDLPGKSKGLVGPWAHEYPEVATPEPAIGFLQECLRWWDHWLKGEDTGIMKEPKLTSWIQNSEKPQVTYEERPGKWVADNSWPSKHVTNCAYWLRNGNLAKAPVEKSEKTLIPSVQEHGFYSGVFCPFGQPGDLPADQRLENGKAVTFTSEPLEDTIELLGHPKFYADLSSDQEDAFIAVRLMDKAPTGESTLISWGMLNLTHRHSHEYPEKLVVGQRYKVEVKLDALGQQIPKGHRIEIAVAPTYWPSAWPSPKPVNLTLYSGKATRLELPVRSPQQQDETAGDFDAPETAPVMEREIIRKEKRTRQVIHEPITGEWTLSDYSDEGERCLPENGLQYGSVNKNVWSIREGDPLSAHNRCEWELTIGRGQWQTKVQTCSDMWSDETTFYLVNKLVAFEGDKEIFSKTWETEIDRDHV
ncbi:CocE/NonD family hydrolase [Salipaludibacillus agaradhaerens]|uniref:CocE/NonD family hydrolase n=1 Tax=Salipaludibacillus agaradhaerens TaxID=76935 RepID=UPI0021510FAA|nr:CocE/NonD family hydrolase [Salipaludibacillus agaradhaerens]MCR6120414.1 CocE/NonD family hydrolase [Salipaludibacillus agaradhaerens]UJW59865.1 CocE/NonD family hydrolase [Bacillus sp. A116_S68]